MSSSSPSLPLAYAVFSPSGWHEDENRRFLIALPRPMPLRTPLLDAERDMLPVGEVIKTWPSVGASSPVRICIEPRHLPWALALRDDMLVHRRNVAIDADGRLLVVGRVDTTEFPAAAARVQRDPQWHRPPHIVV